MKKIPFVVCIVLNWNGLSILYNNESILKLTLTTLSKTKYKNFKVIVADATSKDDSKKFIRDNFKTYKILNVENKGFAYANNEAIKYAYRIYPKLDFILLLNNDLIFNDVYWLEKFIKVAKDKRIGIVGSILKYPNGKFYKPHSYIQKFLPFNPNQQVKGFVESVLGATFLIKRNVLENIGGIDEIYLPFFNEETDFCARAAKNNYRTYCINNTDIVHLESYSTFKAKKIKRKWSKNKMLYFRIRNDWIYLLRWHKYLFPINLIYDVLQAFISIDQKVKFRKFSEIKKRLKFTIKGIKEAIKLYKKDKVPTFIKPYKNVP